jgi:hypothetical protein
MCFQFQKGENFWHQAQKSGTKAKYQTQAQKLGTKPRNQARNAVSCFIRFMVLLLLLLFLKTLKPQGFQ